MLPLTLYQTLQEEEEEEEEIKGKIGQINLKIRQRAKGFVGSL